MSTRPKKAPWLPPRWFVRVAWVVHRVIYAVTRGRFGLRPASAARYGMLQITTVGRRTRKARRVILGYVEDGPNLVLVAMNGWANPEPAWWLNLQAHPEATVVLPGGTRDVIARLAAGEERSRLWAKFSSWRIDDYASLRSRETAIIILEPRPV